MRAYRSILTLITAGLSAGAAEGGVLYSFGSLDDATGNQPLGLTVPDGDPSGRVVSETLVSDITSIVSVSVSLDISGGYNGDLYVHLVHGSGFAVLLNRAGRSDISGLAGAGYGDTGFLIDLADGANNIHLYQDLTHSYNANGQLEGTWAPDGRAVDPDLVLHTDVSTATLGSFAGGDANGEWTLYFADLSGGGVSTLDGWSLDIEAVPEVPGPALAGVLGVFALVQGARRWRRRRSGSGE